MGTPERLLHVQCATARELISARLDGELRPGEGALVDRHLTGCSACRRFEADAGALHRSLRVRAADEVPDLVDAVLAAGGRPARSSRPRFLTAAAVAVAVGTLVAATIGVVVVTRSDMPPAAQLTSVSGVAAASDGRSSTAAYLTIVNDGGEVGLIGASSADAIHVTLHATEVRDGMTFMRRRERYDIGANGTTEFRPGGAHLMLEGLDEPLRPGQRVVLVLTFEGVDPVRIDLEVVDPATIN